MVFFIFFQSREQQLIHAHTLRLCISLDLLTLSLWHVQTDIIVMSFEVFRVRSRLLPLLFRSTFRAVFLRAGGHGIGLTADRTNLFAADPYGSAGLLLLRIGSVPLDLNLITAVDTVFCTVRGSLKLHTAHFAFTGNQAYSPLESVYILILSDIGCKVKHNRIFI